MMREVGEKLHESETEDKNRRCKTERKLSHSGMKNRKKMSEIVCGMIAHLLK